MNWHLILYCIVTFVLVVLSCIIPYEWQEYWRRKEERKRDATN